MVEKLLLRVQDNGIRKWFEYKEEAIIMFLQSFKKNVCDKYFSLVTM